MKYKELLDDICYDCKSYPCNMLKNNTHCHTYNELIEALEKQKWHKTIEEKPTEEGQYLCCDVYDREPFFKVMRWSNDLYEVDDFDFYERKGVRGFYRYDSEWGYLKSSCDYWKPIDWSEKE